MVPRHQLNLLRGFDFLLGGKLELVAFEIGYKLCPTGVEICLPDSETVGT
jgi:hypothetical protein